ncbi:hypothetical protein PHYSODRAFT_516812, partial [Phytophthora sojae]
MSRPDTSFLLMLCASSQTRRRSLETLRDLRRRLHDERRRWEWQRLTRMRHYITLDCLKEPEQSSWMDTWLKGTDENMINVTSLSRALFNLLLSRFAPHYEIPIFYSKGGRPRKLQHHHQVLGLLL